MSLGVGIFVLPATLKQMGMVSGLVAILWFAVWSYVMQCILIQVAKKQNPPVYSYEDLAERVLGKPGAFLLVRRIRHHFEAVISCRCSILKT